jgi:hypothetical protein
MKRIIIIFLINALLVLPSGLIFTKAIEESSSTLIIRSDSYTKWDNQEFNFYYVYDGEILKTNLILQNTSDKIIDGTIRSTIPFITIGPIDQFSINPEEEIVFELTLDSTDQENKHYLGGRILIQTDEEGIEIPIRFFIKPKIQTIEIVSDATEHQSNSLEYTIDGEKQTFWDPPEIINGRTFIEFRSINDIFGTEADYDIPTKTLFCYFRKSVVAFTHNKTIVKLNNEDVQLDIPALILAGRFRIPLRFMAEKFLGATVDWNPIEHKILITYDLSKRPQITN